MNKKNKEILFAIFTIFTFTLLLSGCSENYSSGDFVYTEFIGSWVGNMEYSMSEFRGNFSMFNNTNMTRRENISSANITMLEFTKDTVIMTLTSDNGTQTISNSYKIEGDKLVFSIQSGGQERPNRMEPPQGWEEPPPFDGENPFNNSHPFNDSRPFDQQPNPRTQSYNYSFNENNTILYLNGSEFVKIE